MREHEKKLLSLPNVTGVGIGEKNDRDVIIVFVEKMVPESELAPHEKIPKMLDGFETYVRVRLLIGDRASSEKKKIEGRSET
jgi:hypothetical protein